MSNYDMSSLVCNACQASFTAATAESVNVTRMPGMRQTILDGEFHRVECPHCHHRSYVDRQFLYTDIKRNHFVHVYPRVDLRSWPRLEEATGQVFYNALDGGPPVVQQLATELRVRTVFGPAALTDKLRIWDAGLDDGLVEVLKLELFAGAPELRGRNGLNFVVTAITDERIEVEVAAPGADVALYGLSRARYAELDAARADLEQKFPGLFFKPFVSFYRLALEGTEELR